MSIIQGLSNADKMDKLKEEIKDLKKVVANCTNTDYVTGFICALSNVEGIIAEMENKNNEPND